mgnify:CR=1 FL=1
MAFKRILVHVNVSKHCPVRLTVAGQLAKAFGAHLTGAFTSAAGDIPFFMMQEVAARTEPTMQAWWLQARDRLKASFDGCLRESGGTGDWLEIGGDVVNGIAACARTADLTVVGQVDADEFLPRPEYAISERLALDAGGPALLIPLQGAAASVGRRILVAWDGSTPAARALKDALPFLERAERVAVLTIDTGKAGMENVAGADAVAWLARHGVKAEARAARGADAAVGDVLLAETAADKADLVVMGAYGHSRAREFILGGATRTMLQRMTVPVLMAH